MYDADTVELISGAPPLEGLDLTRLPQELTQVFAQIVSARVRLRGLLQDDALPTEIASTIRTMRRLASTNEALVSTVSTRHDRAAAAFVAGSAHHVCNLADNLRSAPRISRLGIEGISPEVSAALLFLIAEASSDAAEMVKQIIPQSERPVEFSLLTAIKNLAIGRLDRIIEPNMPPVELVISSHPGQSATDGLYFMILRGVRALAREILDPFGLDFEEHAVDIFAKVITMSAEPLEDISSKSSLTPYSIFSGPLHLASLLLSVARDFPSSSLVRVPSPQGVDNGRWVALMKQIAQQRPYVWRNHRQAIVQGYLETGISAAVSFPTGGGKSKLAELKIAGALLRGAKVIFLVPTLALVDQTANALSKTFPQAQIQQERSEEVLFSVAEIEPLPGISVFTPERCLAMLSFAREIFSDVGLVIFDECHLMHPRSIDTSRRSIDAMLTLLNLTAIAKGADLLLLSAMMKNTTEIASWVKELTDRPCLALDLKWKPTRQVRGCVVYESDRIIQLRKEINVAQKSASTKNPPASLKRTLTARPFGFFCLHQTWISDARRDYSLIPLLDEETKLATGTGKGVNKTWYLTPNGNQVSATIGAATSKQNLKTLIFAQTIPLCKSTSSTVDAILGPAEIPLSIEETQLYQMAVDEAGGADYLYISVSDNNTLTNASACHHGLLILQERQLHEDLFRRRDGINVLVATSTLAQGMNLPSEVVIIAGDSRFDLTANKMEKLEAHELLNAAGRAGRAGDTSQGFVLIVPSKVVDFETNKNQIHNHWSDLKAIFSQSDQCLIIDDPFSALLDQIHVSTTDLPLTAQYLLSRLPMGSDGNEGGSDAPAIELINRSFGAFRARQRKDAEWISSRTKAAVDLRNANPNITNTWIDQISATSGIPADVLGRLAQSLLATASTTPPTSSAWQGWMLLWFGSNPADLLSLVRNESLDGMFGTPYKTILDRAAKGTFAVAAIEKLLPLWTAGETLANIELAFGTPTDKLGYCENAREFVLRIVPELSYVYGILPQLYISLFTAGSDLPVALATIGSLVREGFNSPEKLALRNIRKARMNRVAVHQEHAKLAPYIASGMLSDSFLDVIDRVREATSIYDAL